MLQVLSWPVSSPFGPANRRGQRPVIQPANVDTINSETFWIWYCSPTSFTIIPIPICSASDPFKTLKHSCWYNLALVKHLSCCETQRFLPGSTRWAHSWPDPTAPRCQPCWKWVDLCDVCGELFWSTIFVFVNDWLWRKHPVMYFLLCFRRARWWQKSQVGWSTFCRLDHILRMPSSSAVVVVFNPCHFCDRPGQRQEYVSQRLLHSDSLKSNLFGWLNRRWSFARYDCQMTLFDIRCWIHPKGSYSSGCSSHPARLGASNAW